MIKQETFIDENGNATDLIRTYSDSGKKIIQNETGIEYNEAVDCVPLRFTYSESENDREVEEDVVEHENE